MTEKLKHGGMHHDEYFTRIEKQPDVHFAHARGFVAKTSAVEIQRVRELLMMARL